MLGEGSEFHGGRLEVHTLAPMWGNAWELQTVHRSHKISGPALNMGSSWDILIRSVRKRNFSLQRGKWVCSGLQALSVLLKY